MERPRHPDVANVATPMTGSFVAELLKRIVWLTAVFFALALTFGPLFAPAAASMLGQPQFITLTTDLDAMEVTQREGYSALRCRSKQDGRQEELVELVEARFGGAPITYIATRFWDEQSGTAKVTIEFWDGQRGSNRRLRMAEGSVDLETCGVSLNAIT